VEYGENMGVEYGENSPSNERHEASCSREFSPNDGFGRFLALYWGGIPRKKWAKDEVVLGWNAEKHLFFVRWNVEKTSHAKTGLTKLFTFSIFTSFLKRVHSPPVWSGMRTNQPFSQPAALYQSAAGGKCRPAIS
jgi:hypothetical protein